MTVTAKADFQTEDILKKCSSILDEKKAEDTVVLDLSEINSYFDYFIITTGNSQVHCKSLARDLEKSLSEEGLKEGMKPDFSSGWIVLDYSNIIVHVFTEDMRQYYQLEKLWGDARSVIFS
jgi:ribosome-associated protein